jgi:surface antigen
MCLLVGATLAGCAAGSGGVGDKLDTFDRQRIIQTTQLALENNKIGEGSNWANPASGHRGTVTPTRTYKSPAGEPCRELQQTVAVEAQTSVAYDSACRRADGVWYSVHYDSLVAAIAGAWPNRAGYYGRPYGHGYYGRRYPYYGHRYPYYGYGDPYYGYGDPFYDYGTPGYLYGRGGFGYGFRFRFGHRRRH